MRHSALKRVLTGRRRLKQRWRDAAYACGSVVLHIALLLLLPGLGDHVPAPRELLVEIIRPASALAASGKPDSRQTAPDPDNQPLEQAEAAPSEPEPAPQERTAEGQPAGVSQPEAQPVKAQPQQPVESAPAPGEATEVDVAKPVVVDQSPKVVPKPVEDVPVAKSDPAREPQPDKPAQTGPGSVEEPKPEAKPDVNVPAVKPEVPVEKPPAEPKVNLPENGAPDQPKPQPETSVPASPAPQQPAQGPGGTSDSGGQESAPEADPGPPAPPPGPSEHELNLLGDYGDAALKRILSQARNPEASGGGTVVLEFEVDRNGHLVDVVLLKSSGHKILDNDAMEATLAAFNDKWEIIPFPSDVKVDSWKFVRSVKYPLY